MNHENDHYVANFSQGIHEENAPFSSFSQSFIDNSRDALTQVMHSETMQRVTELVAASGILASGVGRENAIMLLASLIGLLNFDKIPVTQRFKPIPPQYGPPISDVCLTYFVPANYEVLLTQDDSNQIIYSSDTYFPPDSFSKDITGNQIDLLRMKKFNSMPEFSYDGPEREV